MFDGKQDFQQFVNVILLDLGQPHAQDILLERIGYVLTEFESGTETGVVSGALLSAKLDELIE